MCARRPPRAPPLNGAYQRAAVGTVVQVASGTYPYQAIQPRADLRNLSSGCTLANSDGCVHFLLSGVNINGSLEVFGSDIWLDGGTDRANPGVVVSGNIDSSTGNSCCAPPTTYPDHLFFQGTRSATFGIFATDTMTWRDFDVGPATVSTNCQVKEGPGAEPMIGPSGVGPFVVPRNITIDGMWLHGQNGDSGRIAEDCHWGGLFLNSANGLTIKNSFFEKNVVYNVEIQNFGGAPPATNVTFDSNSFGCPVDWLYNGAGCDGQSSIQFDGTFPGVTITGNTLADGNGGWGCYRTPCDFSGDTFENNVVSPAP